jgi:hypothetical protein
MTDDINHPDSAPRCSDDQQKSSMTNEIVGLPEDCERRQLSDDAERIFQQGETDVFLMPESGELWCLFSPSPEFPHSHEVDFSGMSGLESGMTLGDVPVERTDDTNYYHAQGYTAVLLNDVPWLRDECERIRDQIRRKTDADRDSLQGFIDSLVAIERAIEYVRATGPERKQHYRRVSALCDDPQEVIETVEQAVEQHSQSAGILGRLRSVAKTGGGRNT